MKRYLKILSLLLSVLMLVSSFAGCKKDDKEENKDVDTYTVRFDANGGEIVKGKAKYTVEESEPFGDFIKKAPTAEKEGFVFVGWFNGETEYNAKNKTSVDIIFTAKWKKQYSVSFDANGGKFLKDGEYSYIFDEGQIYEELIKNPPEVEKSDYFFYEWYCEELDLVYDPSLEVEADAVFKAQWHDSSVMSDQRLQGTWQGKVNLLKVLEANGIDDLPTGFNSSVKVKGYFTFDNGKVSIYTLADDLKSAAPDYLDDLKKGLDSNDELLYDVIMLAYELDSREDAKNYIKENPPYIKSAWKTAVKLMIPELDVSALIDGFVDSDGRYVLVENAEYTMDADTNTLTINKDSLTIVPDSENDDVFKFTKANGVCEGYKGAKLTRVN